MKDWRVVGEYVFDGEGGRHQAFYSPVRNVTVLGERIKPHERIQVERSLKYSQAGAERLWSAAGMKETHQGTHAQEYGEFDPPGKPGRPSFSPNPGVFPV